MPPARFRPTYTNVVDEPGTMMKVSTSTTASLPRPSPITSDEPSQLFHGTLCIPKFPDSKPRIEFTEDHEAKKVALYKNRRIAWLHAVVHLIPMSAVVVLTTINIKSLYIGDAQSERIIALQFAAKLLEILIQYSIAATALGIIRRYVLQSGSLPFGGLMTPYRTADISYLWSLDFWGCMTSPDLILRQRILLGVVVPVAVLVASLVGPSSAVLMIPRPMNSPNSGQVWLLDPTNEVYPATAKLKSNGTLPEQVMLDSTLNQAAAGLSAYPIPVVDSGGPRGVTYVDEIYIDGNDSAQVIRSLATVPTLLLAEAEWGFYFSEGSISGLAKQAFFYTDCWTLTANTNSTPTFVDFGPGKAYLDNYLNASTLLPSYVEAMDDQSLEVLRVGDGLSRPISIVWSQLPPDHHNHSLLMVTGWLSDPKSAPLNNLTQTDITPQACTVDAYWATVLTDMSFDTPPQSKVPSNQYETPTTALAKLKDKTLIEMSPQWAKEVAVSISQHVDPPLVGSLLNSIEVAYALALSYVPPWRNYIDIFDKINWIGDGSGIWRADNKMSAQQYKALVQYVKTMNLPSQYSVYVLTNDTAWTDPSSLAEVRLTSLVPGYGYNLSPTAVKLSLAVLLLYLTVTTTYLFYSLSTGYTARSWISMAELTALALNSERPKAMVNTSVGINTLETYRRPINIRVNEEESLELVFDRSNEEIKGYTRVVVNEKY